jgi:hypothetical protein
MYLWLTKQPKTPISKYLRHGCGSGSALDPVLAIVVDPDCLQYGSGSSILAQPGSNADPDQQQYFRRKIFKIKNALVIYGISYLSVIKMKKY